MTERASQWRKGCSHSDRQALCQSDVIATWLRHCQRPCPLRRSAPALPKGEPWAKRRSLTEYPKPLPLGEVSPKVTERASQWRKGCSHSDRQALCQSDVIATWLRHCQRPCPLRRSAPALPKGEPWAKRRSLTEYPKPLPLGEVSPKVTERASQWRKGCSHSDRQALCQSDVIATWLRHCRQPCPLRRFAPALPKGEPYRRALTSKSICVQTPSRFRSTS